MRSSKRYFFSNFCNHALADAGNGLAQQTIHGRLEYVQLVLYGEVDEVGVEQQVVGRPQCRVAEEKEMGGLSLDVLHLLHRFFLRLGGSDSWTIGLAASVSDGNDSFHLRELPSFACLSHYNG